MLTSLLSLKITLSLPVNLLNLVSSIPSVLQFGLTELKYRQILYAWTRISYFLHLLLRTFCKLNQNFSSQTLAQHYALLAKKRTIFGSKGLKGVVHPPVLSCSTHLLSKRQEVTQTFFGELPSRFAWCGKPLAWAPQTYSFAQVLVTLLSLLQVVVSRVFSSLPFYWKCWCGPEWAPR